jgi:hypothetical protein
MMQRQMTLTEEMKAIYVKRNITHILHCTDTWDHSRYDVEIKENQIYEEVHKLYCAKSMQIVNGVTWVVDREEYERTLPVRKERILTKQLDDLSEMSPQLRFDFISRLTEERAKAILQHVYEKFVVNA